MRRKNRVMRMLIIAVALIALPLAMACGGDGDSDASSNGDATTEASSNSNGDNDGNSNGGGEAQTVTISMQDNFFEPKDITVKQGTVTFEVTNDGAAIHNMHILSSEVEGEDFMSETTIVGGASDTFTATFTKSGEIKFQCDFHLPDMVGTITVE